MPTMLEALKKAGLAKNKVVKEIEEKRRAALKNSELQSALRAGMSAFTDSERLEEEKKFHKKAAKEGTKAASRVGTKQYFNRFTSK